MDTTLFLTRIIGPVLILRAISILIDKKHFQEMLDGLEREVSTVSFSLFPVALVMSCTALAILHRDTDTLAGILIWGIAIGGLIKGSMLILFPKLLITKAKAVGRLGFINVVCVVCFAVGGYFTWFGYGRG